MCCRAAGWSTLTPNDAEVVANMQSYVRSLLQPTANGQPQYHQQPDHGSAADSRGWSLPQQALVGVQAASWCARQQQLAPAESKSLPMLHRHTHRMGLSELIMSYICMPMHCKHWLYKVSQIKRGSQDSFMYGCGLLAGVVCKAAVTHSWCQWGD